jgi:DNA invertase Pin-like site-specific DNA recombinase
MIGVLAELERSLMIERTHGGIQAAKLRGREIRAQAETHGAADRPRPKAD